MSDALTSNKLIESVKRRASIPENQATFTADDFLAFANEELRLGLVPEILSLHEDYLLYEIELPVIANKSEYEIPSRAVGNKLRDVQFKNSSGAYSELTRVSIGERFNEYDVRTDTNLRKFYIKNNKVVFLPNLDSGANGFIVMIFYIKPSSLVSEDRVGIISGINKDTGVITLSSVPDNFSISTTYDFYKANSPHSILTIDKNASTINATTNSITFAVDDIPDDLSIGDHVALSGECIIPQVPNELQVMLAQMVACRILESIGDTEGLKLALLKLGEMKKATGMIIDNRVDDAPKKIVNRHGLVRTAVFSKRFTRG